MKSYMKVVTMSLICVTASLLLATAVAVAVSSFVAWHFVTTRGPKAPSVVVMSPTAEPRERAKRGETL